MSQQKKMDNILVVDDDPVIRDMMVDILQAEGYSILTARNGREALEIMRREERFLVFLDLMMPVMDGKEVCIALAADPLLRTRHFIVLMSAMDNIAESSSLNINATMPKPFTVEDVIGILQLQAGK